MVNNRDFSRYFSVAITEKLIKKYLHFLNFYLLYAFFFIICLRNYFCCFPCEFMEFCEQCFTSKIHAC